MNSTITFYHPGPRHVVSKISVPPNTDVVSHIRRLEYLGYKIVDVSPPLEHYGPPQNFLLQGLERHTTDAIGFPAQC